MNYAPPKGFGRMAEPQLRASKTPAPEIHRGAHVEKFTDKSAAFGSQAFGVLLWVVAWFVGGVAGFVLFVVGLFAIVHGARKCNKWRCSECRNPLANRDVRACPTCRAQFQ